MSFRVYLAFTVLTVLLIWGPIDHSRHGWLLIRSAYLILIPLTIWLLLGWAWNKWEPTRKLEIMLERILSCIIFIGLIILGMIEATSKTHITNTKYIQTRDGLEPVGDFIEVEGPGWGNVLVIAIIAFLFLWFGVLRKGRKTSHV